MVSESSFGAVFFKARITGVGNRFTDRQFAGVEVNAAGVGPHCKVPMGRPTSWMASSGQARWQLPQA